MEVPWDIWKILGSHRDFLNKPKTQNREVLPCEKLSNSFHGPGMLWGYSRFQRSCLTLSTLYIGIYSTVV